MTAQRWWGLRLACLGFGLAAGACSAVRTTSDLPPLAWQTPASAPAQDLEPTPARPTSVPDCDDAARFLEDLTIPDGTIVAPGAILDKRWSVQNTGTCDWGPDYRLGPVESGGFGDSEPIALYPARAGEQAVWQVEVRAPLEPGEHLSRWQALAPDGTAFGDVVYLLIEVGQSEP